MVRKSRKKSQLQCLAKPDDVIPSSPPWIEPVDVPSYPPWIELPRKITANILGRLDLIERIRNAYNVCITWRYVCQDYPHMWRVIHLSKSASRLSPRLLVSICRKAVYCSHGQLVDITLDGFCTDELLIYIAYSCKCSQLQRLRIVYTSTVTNGVLIKALKKFPILNELYLFALWWSPRSEYLDIEAIGRSCPMLNSFTYNYRVWRYSMDPNDDDAFKVVEFMPGLRHLALLGNKITDEGVVAILDGCQQLESLDIRLSISAIYDGRLSEDTIERCHRQLKQVWLSEDSFSGHEFYDRSRGFGWVEGAGVVINEAPVPSPPWIDLPIDLTANIFSRLSTIERLNGPWEVCTTWRDVCKDYPNMWRAIHMAKSDASHRICPDGLLIMCRNAVDCSHGELVDITMEGFCSDWLLHYIANRCSKLQRLRIASSDWITISNFIEVVKKFPMLNELLLSSVPITGSSSFISAIGQSCPMLKSFTFNNGVAWWFPSDDPPSDDVDDVAVAVAQNMPDLRNLCLIGNTMTGKGLKAILDGCQHLESLDIRKCHNYYLYDDPTEDLKERCRRQIRKVWFPYDSCSNVEFYQIWYAGWE